MSIYKTFKTSISINKYIADKIEERGSSMSAIIRRDLERLYTLYERSLTQMDLTVDECCLIVDVLNGTISDANTAHLLWAQVEDGCVLDKVDAKWNVDGKKLIEKLKNYNEIQCLAIIDAAERFWNNPSYRDKDIKEGVKEVFKLK